MRRQYLAPIALVFLVATAGCLGGTQSLAAPGSDDSTDRRTITVSASGEAATTPDIAIVHMTVEATADDADTARGQVADEANAVRQALLDAGIAEDDITTTRYAIRPEYDHSRDERTVTGYNAVHSYKVVVRNPDDAGSVIDTAVGAGADRVDNVQFGLSDAARQQLREEAIENAMTNARSDASAAASAGDVSLGQVHQAQVSSTPRYYGGVEYAMAADSGGKTQIESGPVSVDVQVTVSYQIA